MVMVTILAASPLFAVGAPRSFLQLIQLLLRPFSNSRFLSRQPVFFAIAPDMLPCEISIRHRPYIQVLLQSSSRSRPSDAYADVQMNLGPGASQSLTSCGATISLSGPHSLSERYTRQSLEPHQSRFRGSISDSNCLLARQCARTSLFLRMATDSCKPFQNHTESAFLLSFFT